MNRGFKHYFREGMSASAETLFKSKGKNHFRYLLFFFAELLGRITLLLTPLFELAKVRQGRVLRTEKRYEPVQSFRRAGEPRPYWTLVLCYLLEGLIILGGVLLIGILTAFLYGVGYGISDLVRNANMLPVYFAIPGGILALVFIVAALLIFAPTPYVIAANENIGVGDTLAVCYNTMKANGMGALFLNVMLTVLPKIVFFGIMGGISYLLYDRFSYEKYYILMLVGINAVGLLVYAVFAPVLTLGRRAANQHLFEDILVDPVAVSKASKGIRISQCRGQKFGENASRQALVAMFDDADAPTDDITLEPKKKKRGKKAPSAEEIYGRQASYTEQAPTQPEYAQPEYAQPAYGQPAAEPTQPEYAQPEYAQPAYEQPAAEPVQPEYAQPEYAQPAYEQPAAEPAQPEYAQPAYEQSVAEPVQPEYTQPVYEQPANEQPAEEPVQPEYAQPAYEQPAAEPVQPEYAQPEYAQPAYEQPAAEPAQPEYAQPVYEQPANEQPAEEPVQPAEGSETQADEPAQEGGADKKPKPILKRRRLK